MGKDNSDKKLLCPRCGEVVREYKNPYPTVDIIIRLTDHPDPSNVVLIERKNRPHGWAIPGGFVDYGESVEKTALREAREETGLDVKLIKLIGVYSKPERDPRFHTITTVFAAEAEGKPIAADDAKDAGIFTKNNLPDEMAFDHKEILDDYYKILIDIP